MMEAVDIRRAGTKVAALEHAIHELDRATVVLEVMNIRDEAKRLPPELAAHVLDRLAERLMELIPNAF